MFAAKLEKKWFYVESVTGTFVSLCGKVAHKWLAVILFNVTKPIIKCHIRGRLLMIFVTVEVVNLVL